MVGDGQFICKSGKGDGGPSCGKRNGKKRRVPRTAEEDAHMDTALNGQVTELTIPSQAVWFEASSSLPYFSLSFHLPSCSL